MTSSALGNVPRSRMQRLKLGALALGLALAVMWSLALAALLPGGEELFQWGVRPRQWRGLAGILWAPLLHNGVAHVGANSIPFFLLGGLVLWRGWRTFCVVTLVATISSGLGAWMLGSSDSVHVGASGLVLGYFGHLLGRAWFDRSFVSLLSAGVTGLFHGGLLWSLFARDDPRISWQMHLFGFLGGVASAALLRKAAAKGMESRAV